jgi:hypothetical protein
MNHGHTESYMSPDTTWNQCSGYFALPLFEQTGSERLFDPRNLTESTPISVTICYPKTTQGSYATGVGYICGSRRRNGGGSCIQTLQKPPVFCNLWGIISKSEPFMLKGNHGANIMHTRCSGCYCFRLFKSFAKILSPSAIMHHSLLFHSQLTLIYLPSQHQNVTLQSGAQFITANLMTFMQNIPMVMVRQVALSDHEKNMKMESVLYLSLRSLDSSSSRYWRIEFDS